MVGDLTDLGLGRREPTDWTHVQRHSLQVHPLAALMPPVEKVLQLPYFHPRGNWNQGGFSSCVGHGSSMMMMILNAMQHGRLTRFDPVWLWNRSKEIDEWEDTNPGDNEGTSVNASCRILNTRGHVKYDARTRRTEVSPNKLHGIQAFKWARTVDDLRACIAVGVPSSVGTSWYDKFWALEDRRRPGFARNEWWTTATAVDVGQYRGGHCYCIHGASDKRQAFKVANSHGDPSFWMPYSVVERLIRENGEFAIVTDV